MGGGFFVGVFGVFILAHAAYSTVQHRNLLKITEEEFSGPPIKVVVELLLGLVFCMWAALTVPGRFLSIHPDSDENRKKKVKHMNLPPEWASCQCLYKQRRYGWPYQLNLSVFFISNINMARAESSKL